MSSTKPLVFIRNPRVRASLNGTLHSIDTDNVPTIFPKQAVKMTSTNNPQDCAPSSAGLRAKIASNTNATPQSRTHRETSGDVLLPERAIASARRIHAATSLTAAADMAMRPTSVVRSLSSASIRARTGKAVMDRATPMKTRNGPWLTPLEIVDRSTTDVPIPRMKGRLMPANAIARAFLPVLLMELMSSSRPTKNKK
ncbi:hypothetical protein EUGRSUZ_B02181 [Eucalyptus grandis]|uniref:Uncharacterized protein n=2 Tax=Eucalyptus grandis TaxID=71139 RepID=A0ACC3LTV6_EUCGR|nr:hypothetical protein EUGRSUZ_B02181 [Eucalyptus grandis]